MDDLRFGAAIRASRVRRQLRQLDLARLARVSPATVSRLERGLTDGLPLATVRRVAGVLEIRVELLPRSRGADLERLVRARHAALSEDVLAWLGGFGWEVRPEVSFASYGERGVVDLLAWHPARRALLVVELKTEIVDVGELLGTLDRKVRLAPEVVARLDWRPTTVGACLVVAESMRNRRAVAAHRGTFGAALPDGIGALRTWLRGPARGGGPVRATIFFSNSRQRNARSAYAPIQRVRRAAASSARA